jgi:hypothetical protein
MAITKLKKSHPADMIDAKALSGATHFVASIFVGRGQYDKVQALTLEEARNAAHELVANHGSGRKALIYAVLADGRQILIPR